MSYLEGKQDFNPQPNTSSKRQNRVAVLLVADAKHTNDPAFQHLIEQLRHCCSYLAIAGSQLGQLMTYADKILTVGRFEDEFDGYKEALTLMKPELSGFELCLLVSSSLLGPFQTLENILHSMEHTDAWCMVGIRTPEGILTPDPSFVAVRSDILAQQEFDLHSPALSWQTYIDATCLAEDFDELLTVPDELLKFGIPMLHRESFQQPYMDAICSASGGAVSRALKYIGKTTYFNPSIILNSMMEQLDPDDLNHLLGLHLIVSDSVPEVLGECSNRPKTALIMSLFYEDQVSIMLQRASYLPPDADIIAVSSKPAILSECEKKLALLPNRIFLIDHKNRGRDVAALLVAAREIAQNYELLCVIHDKKSSHISYANGRMFRNHCLDNLLKNSIMVENIIKRFASDEQLGMMAPPLPVEGKFYGIISREWTNNFPLAIKLAEQLDLRCTPDPDKMPVAPYGGMFWCRIQAIAPLLSCPWTYEDFPEEPVANDGTILHAIERLYGFICQSQGLLPAYVLSDSEAPRYIGDLYFTLREQNRRRFRFIHGVTLREWTENFDELTEYYIRDKERLQNDVKVLEGRVAGLEEDIRERDRHIVHLDETILMRDISIRSKQAAMERQRNAIQDLEKEIERLVPMTSLRVQLRSRLSRLSPLRRREN